MITQKQLEANRRNAKLSTGPRTQEGKDRARMNAITHGLTASTLTVLPSENCDAYEERVEIWLEDHQPRNDYEDRLIRHAVDVSWKLDRAKRYERSKLSDRIAAARVQVERVQQSQLEALMIRLVRSATDTIRLGSDPVRAAVLLEQIERTAEGCKSLYHNWKRLRTKVSINGHWSIEEELHAVRLLGFGPETVDDAELLDFVIANRVLRKPEDPITPEKWDTREALVFYDTKAAHAACLRKPKTKEAAMELVLARVDKALARLQGLWEDRCREGEKNEAALAHAFDLASFDPSEDAERIRRYQVSLTREMIRAVETVRKSQRSEDMRNKEKSRGAEGALQSGSENAGRIDCIDRAGASVVEKASGGSVSGAATQSDAENEAISIRARGVMAAPKSQPVVPVPTIKGSRKARRRQLAQERRTQKRKS